MSADCDEFRSNVPYYALNETTRLGFLVSYSAANAAAIPCDDGVTFQPTLGFREVVRVS
jgi:hypothetical protein